MDREFVQYYPVALRWPVTRLLASPTLFPLGARLYNARGERFMANLPQGCAVGTPSTYLPLRQPQDAVTAPREPTGGNRRVRAQQRG